MNFSYKCNSKPNKKHTIFEVDATEVDAAVGEEGDILNYDDLDDPDAPA